MGDARTVDASVIISNVQTELRENTTTPRDFTNAVLLIYLKKCHGLIHDILVKQKSELVLTGTGSFSTVAGTEGYVLSANSMGDLIVPHTVWVSGSDPMTEGMESGRYQYQRMEEESDTSARQEPTEWYLEGGNINLMPFPDQAYTVYLKYFPNYVPLTDEDADMPFRNLFNSSIEEGMKLIAKHSHNRSVNIDAALQQIFHDAATDITHDRKKNDARFYPAMRRRRGQR